MRIYTDGIFDLFHYGHALQFKQIKDKYPDCTLVVGVCGDKITHQRKGKTVLTEMERYETVRHSRYVDEVIEDAPWIITPEFMKKHQIEYVAHDPEPYYDDATGEDVYKWIKSIGRFIPTLRTQNISTSDIISRILSQRNEYFARNIVRGSSPKELNITIFQIQYFRMLNWVRNKKDSINVN